MSISEIEKTAKELVERWIEKNRFYLKDGHRSGIHPRCKADLITVIMGALAVRKEKPESAKMDELKKTVKARIEKVEEAVAKDAEPETEAALEQTFEEAIGTTILPEPKPKKKASPGAGKSAGRKKKAS